MGVLRETPLTRAQVDHIQAALRSEMRRAGRLGDADYVKALDSVYSVLNSATHVLAQVRERISPKADRVYYVNGRGAFPFDMLRRDQARFATDEAATMATGSGARRLAIYGPEPTDDRWASFGWRVEAV